MRRVHLCLVALVACKGSSAVGVQGPPATTTATATALDDAGPQVATVDAGAPVTPPVEGPLPPLHFGTRPDPKAPLAYVADGYCVGMKVDFLGDETFVESGKAGASTLARATRDGLADWDALSKGATEGWFLGLAGKYPDGLYAQLNVGGRAYDSYQVMQLTGGAWQYVLSKPTDTTQHAKATSWSGGVVAQRLTDCSSGSGCTYGPLVGVGVTAPPLAGDGFEVLELVPFATGELYAIGQRAGYLQARRFKPGGKPAVDVLPVGMDAGFRISVSARDPSDVWVAIQGGALLHFDGAKWAPISPAPKDLVAVYVAPNAETWIRTTTSLSIRSSSGAMTDVTPPGPLVSSYVPGLRALDGIEVGAPWAALADGRVAKFEQGKWITLALPKSPFAWIEGKNNTPNAEGVRVRSKDDVWVDAKYVEWPSHYYAQIYEERRALLRTIPPKETLRCRARGTGWMGPKYEDGSALKPSGFESWPPLATPECKTPIVLIASVDPKTTSVPWNSNRAVLKGKTELDGITLIEFVASQRKILGARVPSFDVGKKMLAILGKSLTYSAPEMVCADPENATERPFDVASGNFK